MRDALYERTRPESPQRRQRPRSPLYAGADIASLTASNFLRNAQHPKVMISYTSLHEINTLIADCTDKGWQKVAEG